MSRLNGSLALLADNDTNDITAEILRQILEDIYTDAVLNEDIVDNFLETQGYNLALSAGRGANLNTRLVAAEAAIQDFETRITNLENA